MAIFSALIATAAGPTPRSSPRARAGDTNRIVMTLPRFGTPGDSGSIYADRERRVRAATSRANILSDSASPRVLGIGGFTTRPGKMQWRFCPPLLREI